MKREEQDKNWAELSEESKQARIKAYNDLLELNSDSKLWLYSFALYDLEALYGKHNLKPSLTYEDVAKELFVGHSGFDIKDEYGISDVVFVKDDIGYIINNIVCTSFKQAKKILAINKLLNVAKFLNKNEDGSDWKPNLDNWDERPWCIYYNVRDKKIGYTNESYCICSPVHFRTKEIAQQAVQILGEDVVRTALTTKY